MNNVYKFQDYRFKLGQHYLTPGSIIEWTDMSGTYTSEIKSIFMYITHANARHHVEWCDIRHKGFYTIETTTGQLIADDIITRKIVKDRKYDQSAEDRRLNNIRVLKSYNLVKS